MGGAVQAVAGSLLVAALSTLGDFVWARYIPSHHPLFGLLHGMALCFAIGLFLGGLRREPWPARSSASAPPAASICWRG